MMRDYEIKSLPPGFIFITCDPTVDFEDLRLPSGEWEKLVKLGYSGGVIVPEGTTIDSLDDKLMADLGWQRITK